MDNYSGLKVFMSYEDTSCSECNQEVAKNGLIFLTQDRKVLCLECADLDHLVYLPSGNTALTRRARKYSHLSAEVLKWSKARKRNERQGLLVEMQALERAEQENLSDEEARAKRREREAVRREKLDAEYTQRFAVEIRRLFPGMPAELEHDITEHATLKYSGRVGRTADAKNLDERKLRLAVIAHIRHTLTQYDELLGSGYERDEARAQVRPGIEQILDSWKMTK